MDSIGPAKIPRNRTRELHYLASPPPECRPPTSIRDILYSVKHCTIWHNLAPIVQPCSAGMPPTRCSTHHNYPSLSISRDSDPTNVGQASMSKTFAFQLLSYQPFGSIWSFWSFWIPLVSLKTPTLNGSNWGTLVSRGASFRPTSGHLRSSISAPRAQGPTES